MLVEASIYDDFVARFAEYAKQVKVGDPLDPETQVGSLISTAHRDRVHGYVEAGRGGRRGRHRRRPGEGRAPSTSRPCSRRSTTRWTVAQEEIFGPVVTVIPFEDEKDAIRIANDVRTG